MQHPDAQFFLGGGEEQMVGVENFCAVYNWNFVKSGRLQQQKRSCSVKEKNAKKQLALAGWLVTDRYLGAH